LGDQGYPASGLTRKTTGFTLTCIKPRRRWKSWLPTCTAWPFILKSGAARDYARKRITGHLARFNYLHDSIRKNNINERYLLALETMDNIFPEVDFRDFNP
jgi:predicted glycosyl hydrolase (DUF1957 family)